MAYIYPGQVNASLLGTEADCAAAQAININNTLMIGLENENYTKNCEIGINYDTYNIVLLIRSMGWRTSDMYFDILEDVETSI